MTLAADATTQLPIVARFTYLLRCLDGFDAELTCYVKGGHVDDKVWVDLHNYPPSVAFTPRRAGLTLRQKQDIQTFSEWVQLWRGDGSSGRFVATVAHGAVVFTSWRPDR